MVDSILVDDGTYMMIQIYNHQFSCNVGIHVRQVFLETFVPSAKILARVNKFLYMKALKEIIVGSHTQVLLPLQIEYWMRGLN